MLLAAWLWLWRWLWLWLWSEKSPMEAPRWPWVEDEEEDTDEEVEVDKNDEFYVSPEDSQVVWIEQNLLEPRRTGDSLREEFLSKTYLKPPSVMRVIDIHATCESGHVMLVDYHAATASGYSAISHTYGQEVYSVFDCQCSCHFSCSENYSMPPRCCDRPCPHASDGDEKERRDRVVSDILGMCAILQKAGVKYAWHDGVCIAQHDEDEVKLTIQSMGWIYASADETIVFLHYVGKPMAPIAPRGCGYDLVSRWHTRVWTLQEAALSKARRYCVRVCNPPVSFEVCKTYSKIRTLKRLLKKMKAFEQSIGLWYMIESSEIDVITEDRFMIDFLKDAEDVASSLYINASRMKREHPLWCAANEAFDLDGWLWCFKRWFGCLSKLKSTLQDTCLGFPELGTALEICSRRDSKHLGDRINSILTIAQLRDFVVPKDFYKTADDDSMEAWTIEFLKRLGQAGLGWAAFTINVNILTPEDMQVVTHTWVPLLWKPLKEPEMDGNICSEIEFKVQENNGRLQLKGHLICMAVTFKVRPNKPDKAVSNATDVDVQGSRQEACADDELKDMAYMHTHQVSVYPHEEISDSIHVSDQISDCEASEHEYIQYEDDEGSGDEHIDYGDDEGSGDEHIDYGDDDEVQVIEELVETRDRLDVELNPVIDGFSGYSASLDGTKITMGAAHFAIHENHEGGDGSFIAGFEIKDEEGFDAYLVAPLHYDWEVEWQPLFIIVQGNLDDHVSKIGIFTMFPKLRVFFAKHVQMSVQYPAYRVLEDLVIL